MLVETDAPYLAPQPIRGRKNEPAHVAFTCAILASARSEDPQTLAATTTANARRLLGLPDPSSASPVAPVDNAG